MAGTQIVNYKAPETVHALNGGHACWRPCWPVHHGTLYTSVCVSPQVVYSAFMFYATGGNDPYHMPLNSFTSFLDDAAIPDPDSLSIKRSDCDTIFIVCNFQPDKNSPDVAVNDEHAMMRFEFLEAIVRLGEVQWPFV